MIIKASGYRAYFKLRVGDIVHILDLDGLPGTYMALEIVTRDPAMVLAESQKTPGFMLYTHNGNTWFDYGFPKWKGTYQIPERMGTWTLQII